MEAFIAAVWYLISNIIGILFLIWFFFGITKYVKRIFGQVCEKNVAKSKFQKLRAFLLHE